LMGVRLECAGLSNPISDNWILITRTDHAGLTLCLGMPLFQLCRPIE
jgi:hypothetical protein